MKDVWDLISIFGFGQLLMGIGGGIASVSLPYSLGSEIFTLGVVITILGTLLVYKSYPYGMALRDGKDQVK